MPIVCPTYVYTMVWTRSHWLNNGIKDQLITLHSLMDRGPRCVLRSLISYFAVSCFQRKALNTTKLLNHVALSVELLMKK